ncbi:MAG: hypothetical protein CL912_00855 [Deltaproteobacteria bacterium]|nr:hypothetical protein [Deltaproteobacteria bacterium]
MDRKVHWVSVGPGQTTTMVMDLKARMAKEPNDRNSLWENLTASESDLPAPTESAIRKHMQYLGNIRGAPSPNSSRCRV